MKHCLRFQTISLSAIDDSILKFLPILVILNICFLWLSIVLLHPHFLWFVSYPSIIRWYNKRVLNIFPTTAGDRRHGRSMKMRAFQPLKPRLRRLLNRAFQAYRTRVKRTWGRRAEFIQWLYLFELCKCNQHFYRRNYWNGHLKITTDDLLDNANTTYKQK